MTLFNGSKSWSIRSVETGHSKSRSICRFDPGLLRRTIAYVKRLKNVPIWFFHWAKDRVIPIEESRRLVDALKAVGSRVLFSVSPDTKHDARTKTYANPDVFASMLKQQRAK